jgi:hypothetical protein
MAKAFEDAVTVVGIVPRDETKREAVARFILHLAEIDGGLDSATLRDKAVMALGGSIHVVISSDGQPNASRPWGERRGEVDDTMIEERWVVVAVNPRNEDGEAKSRDLPSNEIALGLARDWLRQGHDVLKIEGPNGTVIDK